MVKTVAIIQARMSSKRLPGKVLLQLDNDYVLDWVIDRSSASTEINEIVVACTNSPADDILAKHLKQRSILCFRGDENDVLARYFHAARLYNANLIVRITADCPLVDAYLIDKLVQTIKNHNFDYTSNTIVETFPDGFDVEVFTFHALQEAHFKATSHFDREHVTPYMKRSLKTHNLVCKIKNCSDIRVTIDTPDDITMIRSLLSALPYLRTHDHRTIIAALQENRAICKLNQGNIRNVGSKMSDDQKLWERGKKIILGGNMLISKRPEMFAPGQWPAYFDTAKGCTITTKAGKKLLDTSLMGIGTNLLGYGDETVDNSVREVIQKGNMSTLNCFDEVELAEKLKEVHGGDVMCKFTRSGGEANALALRIARSFSKRDKVAVCGYHGWHDWYLSMNLDGDDSLQKHLLSGLSTNGIPSALKNTTVSFIYNDLETLTGLVKQKNIGTIYMEVQRNSKPDENFLMEVRRLADENRITLIFDECTSGFRETYGGLYKKYAVEPDIAIYGKALGNGYAIAAIVGKREVMLSAEDSFISSTFWTERIGYAAACATLDRMKETLSWEYVTNKGMQIKSDWASIFAKYDFDNEIMGLDAMPMFKIKQFNDQIMKTFISQEMLKRGFLATNSMYLCLAHNEEVLTSYLTHFSEVMYDLSKFKDDRELEKALDGPVAHATFTRLN